MKNRGNFLGLLVFAASVFALPSSYAGMPQPLTKAVCLQFYLNDKSITVYELLKRNANEKLNFPAESYFPYLSKFFPEFNEAELVMLMIYMKAEPLTYAQISGKFSEAKPQEKFYINHTPSRWIIARRVLKSAGSNEITLSNVQTLSTYLLTHSEIPESQLFESIRHSIIAGQQSGLTTEQILTQLP